ncbi:hypothetical protein BH11PLA2_BH11PLA2_16450 [soil metagenome]
MVRGGSVTRKAAKSGKRTSPLIWVKQVTLFKSISPVEEIRTIPFSLGLNIIQGKSDDSAQAFETGHGNGKTTLCRLIRFCLGEESFGQKHLVAEIKHCFRDGYVGAVIVVNGEEWAVLRTVGNHRKEYARQGVSLAELIAAEERPAYLEFLKHIRSVVLSKLQQRNVLPHGEEIEWLHVLALCSRDQEARYDRFWNVRPSRSDSGLSKFTKADVSLCVRGMLGLLDIREPQILKRQTDLDSELNQQREKIKTKAAEPAFHISQIRNTLLTEYEVRGADEATWDQQTLGSIQQMRDARIDELKKEKDENEQKVADLDTQINGATARLNEIHESQEQNVEAKVATSTGSVVLQQSVSAESQRQTILEKMDKLCPSGVLARNCDCAQAKKTQLEEQIAEQKQTAEQRQATRTIQQRDQLEAGLEERAKRQENPLEEIRARLKQLNKEKNEFLKRTSVISELLRMIPIVTDDLLKWHRIEQGMEPNQELTTLLTEEKQKVDEGEQLKTELVALLAIQNERIQQFQQHFHSIVQHAITTSFKGVVLVAKEELTFRIRRERSLAGEAYETLAVLLADLAILMESSSDSVCHPGLLIHDSPREADLNVRLYERLLETAYELMTDESDSLPFQYIVTTTTQPPEALRSEKVLKATLSGGTGSLFGRQLETAEDEPVNQATLFDQQGDA